MVEKPGVLLLMSLARLGVVAGASVVVWACTPSTDPPTTSDVDVSLELSVEVLVSREVRLVGRTNLPDDTELMTSVKGTTLDFYGQDSTTVRDGQFSSGPFGPAGGLEVGEFTADVGTPYPRLQPGAVQAVIGEKGEHLHGPLVEQDSMFGATVSASTSYTTVSASTSYTVGEDEQVKEAEAVRSERNRRAPAEARAFIPPTRALVQHGRNMEQYRARGDLARLERCGQLMRQYQSEVRELALKLDELPLEHSFELQMALSSLQRCVSCLASATEYCDSAEESLLEAESLLLNR